MWLRIHRTASAITFPPPIAQTPNVGDVPRDERGMVRDPTICGAWTPRWHQQPRLQCKFALGHDGDHSWYYSPQRLRRRRK